MGGYSSKKKGKGRNKRGRGSSNFNSYNNQRISNIRKITDYPNLEPMGPATMVELGADEVQF